MPSAQPRRAYGGPAPWIAGYDRRRFAPAALSGMRSDVRLPASDVHLPGVYAATRRPAAPRHDAQDGAGEAGTAPDSGQAADAAHGAPRRRGEGI